MIGFHFQRPVTDWPRAVAQLPAGAPGWYEITFIGQTMTLGSARTTLQGLYRVNGGTVQRRGTMRAYTRGAAYGNATPGLMCIVQLAAGDYVEVGTQITDTDQSYTINTSGAEVEDDAHYFCVRLVA